MNKVFSIKKKIKTKRNDKKTMQRRMIFVFLVKYILLNTFYFYTYINYNSYKKQYLLYRYIRK